MKHDERKENTVARRDLRVLLSGTSALLDWAEADAAEDARYQDQPSDPIARARDIMEMKT